MFLFHGLYMGYWFGRSQSHHEGLAAAIADRLVPMVSEVKRVNDPIMRLKISHSMDVIALN